VFFRKESDEQLAVKLGLTVEELVSKINSVRTKVLGARSKRIRPGLDYKILASWNGLMLKGLCEAYRAFDKKEYLELSLQNAQFILDNLISEEGRLTRITSPKSSPEERTLNNTDNSLSFGEGRGEAIAFLDDYANIIDAFITLYEVTFDEAWLHTAKKLTDQAITHYYDETKGIFFYTADDDEQLIARKSEIMDSVTPASNSVMAHNLKKLGLLFDDERYLEISAQLLRNVVGQIAKYGSSYSNWCMLLLNEVFGVNEIAITGEKAEEKRIGLEKNYIPNKIILGGKKGSLPLLLDKFAAVTRIYVCKDKTCGLPAENIEDALKQINV
jgi:uncharacterized protein YyaL (SSP411 family)